MMTLVEALASRLEPDTFELGGDREIVAARVILAVPAFVAAQLVAGCAPELSAGLRTIRYASLATVALGYRREDVDHPLDGFGFLVASIERRALLGATWASTKFDGRAPAGHVLVRAFLGGAHHPLLLELDDDALLELAERELRGLLGLHGSSVLRRLHRWENAYPQYDLGHLERVADLEALCPPGLALAGHDYRGIGLADAIHSACEAVQRVAAESPIDAVFQLTPPQPPC